jgi:formylglycine-generating enzyme required for sulfatase activity
MLVTVNQSLNSEPSMNLFKTVVVCVVISMCGCDQGQPTAPVATNNPAPVAINNTPPVATNNKTPVELPESADSIGMEFKLIPAGTFTMGEKNKARDVTLTKPFKMGVHEVTQAQYEQVMKNNPSSFKGAENPVEQVSWEDAVEFCRKLSELSAEKAAGNVYRLPTEAQWEYACRAGTTTQFSFGDDESDLGDYAWYRENSASKAHPVGGKQPNAWGLYDMHGNVWEWCQDWYDDYPSGAVTDPTGPASGSYRVYRGGSWRRTAGSCRSASRGRHFPSSRYYDRGFRVSLSPSGK